MLSSILKWLCRKIIIAAPYLTIVALLLALFQSWQANRDSRTIGDISVSISTRYLNTFPQNLPDIVSLVKNTRSKLVVMVDHAAYAHFSDPAWSAEYERALESVNDPEKNIQVEIITYDKATARRKLEDQFRIGDFEAFMKTDVYRRYCKFHHDATPRSADEMYEQIINAGEALLARLQQNGTTRVVRTSDDLANFCWVSDDLEAIFSMHNYGSQPREDSFMTRDDRLIARLNAIAASELASSGPTEEMFLQGRSMLRTSDVPEHTQGTDYPVDVGGTLGFDITLLSRRCRLERGDI